MKGKTADESNRPQATHVLLSRVRTGVVGRLMWVALLLAFIQGLELTAKRRGEG